MYEREHAAEPGPDCGCVNLVVLLNTVLFISEKTGYTLNYNFL